MLRKIIQSSIRFQFKLIYNFTKIVINQYKFVVDFKGMLYFDDEQTNKNPLNLIKDKKFTQKFYQCLKLNNQTNKQFYPYVAQFWGQKNYLRSSISPVVYNNLEDEQIQFSIGLKTKFIAQNLYIDEKGELSYDFFSKEGTCIKGKLSNKLINQLADRLVQRQNSLVLRYKEKQYVIPQREK